MGKIIKPVCVCASVCPSERTLTVVKIGTDVINPRSKNVLVRSTSHYPFSYSAPKIPILGKEVPKISATINTYICLKCMPIAKIFASFRKSGWRNTMVT